MKSIRFKKLFIFISIALCVNANAQMSVFKSEYDDPLNEVSFELNGLIEDVLCSSNLIGINLKLNPNNLTEFEGGIIKIDLKSLSSISEARDKDMKGKDYLDIAKFPIATFRVLGISNHTSSELVEGQKIKCHVTGDLTIKDVKRTIMIPVTFSYFKESSYTKKRAKGNLIAIHAIFKIRLSDYNIKIPQIMAYRLNEEVEIRVNVIASDYGLK